MEHKGKRIRTLRDLNTAMQNRRAVFCPTFLCASKPCPAAWIMQQSGERIIRLIDEGLYIYRTFVEKKPNRNQPPF